MKLIQLFAIFGGFICIQHVSAGCSSSDISKVNKCYTDYMNALRFYGSTFNDYYNYVRKYYILVSWNGVTSLCQTFGTLQYCVKKDCMNNDDFKKVATFGGNSASDYIGNYYAFDYMCSSDGKQHYYKSYTCLISNYQNIGKYCTNYGNDCTSRKNENICFVNDATHFCGSDANAYTNSSLFTTLCHSRPECCSNGSNAVELGIGYILALFVMHAVLKLFN
uniref:Uncharacterized protein n=1 Tax=Panagrolaimus sp. PS1159 TaxID=55785 RepID=A0AC35F1G4_9BILA